jgi:hypothetical protein
VFPDVGTVIVTVGAVSGTAGGATVQVNVFESLKMPSVTTAVTTYAPDVVGVPLMRPVVVAIPSPGGSVVAPYVTGCPAGSLPDNCRDAGVPTVLDWFPGFARVGAELVVPEASADFAPMMGPAKYAATAK